MVPTFTVGLVGLPVTHAVTLRLFIRFTRLVVPHHDTHLLPTLLPADITVGLLVARFGYVTVGLGWFYVATVGHLPLVGLRFCSPPPVWFTFTRYLHLLVVTVPFPALYRFGWYITPRVLPVGLPDVVTPVTLHTVLTVVTLFALRYPTRFRARRLRFRCDSSGPSHTTRFVALRLAIPTRGLRLVCGTAITVLPTLLHNTYLVRLPSGWFGCTRTLLVHTTRWLVTHGSTLPRLLLHDADFERFVGFPVYIVAVCCWLFGYVPQLVWLPVWFTVPAFYRLLRLHHVGH